MPASAQAPTQYCVFLVNALSLESVKVEVPSSQPLGVVNATSLSPGQLPLLDQRLADAEPVTFTGLAEAMGRSPRCRHEMFGSGPWYPGLNVHGPHCALIGRTTTEFGVGETASVEVMPVNDRLVETGFDAARRFR